jgi:integrase
VFPHKTGKRPFYEWQWHWDIARKAAGFPNLRFHSLRHSAASMAVENGASDRQVAELLNHKTLAMVKRYSHVRDAVTRSISEQIAEGLV